MNLTKVDSLNHIFKLRILEQIDQLVRLYWFLEVPHEAVHIVGGEQVLFVSGDADRVYRRVMHCWEGVFEVSVEVGVCVLEAGDHQIFTCSFDDLFICLFIDLPELDATGVSGEHFEIFALSWKPSDGIDSFVDLDGVEGIELLGMRLELSKVLHLFIFILGIAVVVEDDDSAGMVAQCQKTPGVIELEGGDDVFVQNLLPRSLVTEYLLLLVVRSLAGSNFFHISSIHYIAPGCLLEYNIWQSCPCSVPNPTPHAVNAPSLPAPPAPPSPRP